MNKKSSSFSLTDHPFVVIVATLAALIAIFVFVTGSVDLPSIFRKNLQRSITGVWFNGVGEQIVFYDDGLFQIGSSTPISGKYEFIDNDNIRVEMGGLLSFAGPKVYQINISGDSMTWFSSTGEALSFSRNPQGFSTGSEAGSFSTGSEAGSFSTGSEAGGFSTANGLTFAVSNIQIFDADQEGWRQVLINMASKSATENVIISPPFICGQLIDTGGFTRDVAVRMNGSGHFSGRINLPGIWINVIEVYTKIPTNQDLQSLTIYPDGDRYSNNCPPGGDAWRFNLQEPIADAQNPSLDAMPGLESGVLEYQSPGLYRLKLSNFRFVPDENYDKQGYLGYKGFTLRADYELENLGGYDLRLKETEETGFQLAPFLISIDDKGRYMDTGLSAFGKVGPGMTGTGETYIIHALNEEGFDVKWYYFSLASNYGGEVVAQTLIKIPVNLFQQFSSSETSNEITVYDRLNDPSYIEYKSRQLNLDRANYTIYKIREMVGPLVGLDIVDEVPENLTTHLRRMGDALGVNITATTQDELTSAIKEHMRDLDIRTTRIVEVFPAEMTGKELVEYLNNHEYALERIALEDINATTQIGTGLMNETIVMTPQQLAALMIMLRDKAGMNMFSDMQVTLTSQDVDDILSVFQPAISTPTDENLNKAVTVLLLNLFEKDTLSEVIGIYEAKAANSNVQRRITQFVKNLIPLDTSGIAEEQLIQISELMTGIAGLYAQADEYKDGVTLTHELNGNVQLPQELFVSVFHAAAHDKYGLVAAFNMRIKMEIQKRKE